MSRRSVVYIVDDDQASRDSVASLVTEMGVDSRTYESAEQFLEEYDGRRPACLVTDVRMLRMSGLELQEELHRRGHYLATVVLTAYAETPVTVRAIKNGAVTLLEKPCRDLELWDAIRAALSEDAMKAGADERREDSKERIASLSTAEREVLDQIVAGRPNKAIASAMDVSVRTVEVRRQSIFSKIGVNSLAELVRLVVEAEQPE